jgi:DNA-binding winged helix-turn-helix (wHTH) protein/tetratricopeptide (TPR) repeat protein
MGRVSTREPAGDSFSFGPFRLDLRKRVLWRDGELVSLAPKALDLLAALVAQAGDVVRKEDLLAEVWPDVVVEEANLSVNVSALRKVLGDQPDGRPWIQTVPRRGYRFAGPHREPHPGAELPALAVLPFRVLGGAAGEDEYLGVGMADALITRLSRTGRVVVRPTRAVLRFANAAVDPREVGRELKVDAVLDGTVQRQGDRLRVTVQLVPLAARFAPWAERFDAAFTDVFTVQDVAAEQVARALSLELGAAERGKLTRRHTNDLAAFQAYVRGRYFWGRLTGAALERAFAGFSEAVALDASYALPHAGLADIFLILGFASVTPPAEAWRLARQSAEAALARDETLAEAHVSLAYVSLFQDWDWDAAEAGLERAVGLDPHSPAAHQWRALYLDMRGRFDEALRAVRRAQELDPVSVVGSALLGFQHYLARDHARELAQAQQTLDLDPHHFLGHWSIGLAHQSAGRFEDAVAAHREAVRLGEGAGFLKAVLARSLALAGAAGEARDQLAALEGGYVSSFQRATVHLALGDVDRAQDRLEAASEERDPWLVWLMVDPMLDPLRGQPRFVRLERRVRPDEQRT